MHPLAATLAMFALTGASAPATTELLLYASTLRGKARRLYAKPACRSQGIDQYEAGDSDGCGHVITIGSTFMRHCGMRCAGRCVASGRRSEWHQRRPERTSTSE